MTSYPPQNGLLSSTNWPPILLKMSSYTPQNHPLSSPKLPPINLKNGSYPPQNGLLSSSNGLLPPPPLKRFLLLLKWPPILPTLNDLLSSTKILGAQTKRPKTKCPKGQNAWRKKRPEDKTSQGTKRPKEQNVLLLLPRFCVRKFATYEYVRKWASSVHLIYD